MLKSLKQLTHDIRTYVWGVTTNHPSHKDTKIGIIWPIEIRRRGALYGICFQVWLCWPQAHVLNDCAMEADYITSRRGSHA